ncbi:hypothetical protein Q8F55_004609 [Vanrija albida]|uniref:Zn(2)-C6 fungal-type domain-containing protein n=1 Tax=Vanrija albida TaxID=181172 RepID=A0ABR3Q7H3_9TREE
MPDAGPPVSASASTSGSSAPRVPWDPQGYHETHPAHYPPNPGPGLVANANAASSTSTGTNAISTSAATSTTPQSSMPAVRDLARPTLELSPAQSAASKSPHEGTPTTATRKRRRNKAPADLDLDGQDIEYEDPSGDHTQGPVFIHPPKGSVQACVRCHRIKRKCDGAWPRCASCLRADVPCVFELSVATSSYVHKLKATNEDLLIKLRETEERARMLEEEVGQAPQYPPGTERGPLPPMLGGNDLGRMALGDFSKVAENALGLKYHGTVGYLSQVNAHPTDVQAGSDGYSVASSGRLGSPRRLSFTPVVTEILSYEAALTAVKHYFEFNQPPYPLLEKEDVMPYVHEMYGHEPDGELSAKEAAAKDPARSMRRGSKDSAEASPEHYNLRRKFIIYMVLALGATGAERYGDVEQGISRSLFQAAMQYRSIAVEREDVLCVRALLLLALFAMYDPAACSLWQVVGLAGRVVTALNLHRKSDSFSAIPTEALESRRRLFYSWYSIDRVVAATLSKPLSLADHDIDIEYPSDIPGDPECRGIPMMIVTRHIIRLRMLMGKILTTLYSVTGEQNGYPQEKRRAIINSLHTEVDEWIAESPMPKDDDKSRTINSALWWNINYHQMLLMLYRPCPLDPITTPASLRAMYEAAGRLVDLYMDMWQDNRVQFNLIQVIALFVASTGLLCSLCENDTRMRTAEAKAMLPNDPAVRETIVELGLGRYSGPSDPAWHDEIRTRVAQCQDMFDTFGRAIPLSAKYREIFTKISNILLQRCTPKPDSTGTKAEILKSLSDESSSLLTTPSTQRGSLETPADVVSVLPAVSEMSLSESSTRSEPAVPVLAPGAVTADSVLAPDAVITLPNVADDSQAPPDVPIWDAMNQFYYDLGDLFADDSQHQFAPFDENTYGYGWNDWGGSGQGDTKSDQGIGPGQQGWWDQTQ